MLEGPRPTILSAAGFQMTKLPFSSATTKPSDMLSRTDWSKKGLVFESLPVAIEFFLRALVSRDVNVCFQDSHRRALAIAMQDPRAGDHDGVAVPGAMNEFSFPHTRLCEFFLDEPERFGELSAKEVVGNDTDS